MLTEKCSQRRGLMLRRTTPKILPQEQTRWKQRHSGTCQASHCGDTDEIICQPFYLPSLNKFTAYSLLASSTCDFRARSCQHHSLKLQLNFIPPHLGPPNLLSLPWISLLGTQFRFHPGSPPFTQCGHDLCLAGFSLQAPRILCC